MLGNKWSKIASCLPGRTDNGIKNVWNTHLKKRVSPPGAAEERGAASSRKRKNKAGAGAPAAAPSSSTTTATTNCSSGDSGEHQSGAPDDDDELRRLEKLEMVPAVLDDDPAAFDFDMLVDSTAAAETAAYCPAAVSVPSSPCASSTSTSPPAPARPVVDDDLLDLPEIDIDHELWSIIDGDGGGACTGAGTPPAPCQSNATEPNAAASTASHGAE
ncbi:unnamed protein product [Urochloa humidicola]